MKTISKSAQKKLSAKMIAGVKASYQRYSTKCAMSLLGFVEKQINLHERNMRELLNSDIPEFKLVGELNIHACSFGRDYIEIVYNGLEEIVGAAQWEKINQELDSIYSTPETIQEVKEYWATAKAGKITADDIRQHAE
jgi:hypothetical protein